MQRVGAGEQFDFIVLDHKMPGMDGVETLRRLRAAGARAPVAIAAASGRDTLQRALDGEFARGDAPVGILEKPIAADALRAQFAPRLAFRALRSARRRSSVDGSDAGLFDAEALLVEDNARQSAGGGRADRRIGVRAQDRRDLGEEAIESCAERAFDVILMDIQMPGMDGWRRPP